MTLSQLSEAGVSVWLDDLSRGRIASGGVQELIDTREVVGVTTNPTIFAQALSRGEDYAEQIGEIASALEGEITDADVDRAVIEVTTRDVADACEVFAGIHTATQGRDGRVSLEVDPRLAQDTAGTVAAAEDLWTRLDRPNAMIKIPATEAGLPAITEVIAKGISVNVTLVFSLERYRHVVEAYLAGLERAKEAGIDLSTIRSVASVFVSRVDSEVDRRLVEIGSEEALALKGRAGIANSILAYQIFEQLFSSARWEVLEAAGAHRQRPLWASTGVKDPNLPDTLYVTGLVAPDTVNTMPEKTLEAFADHGAVEGDVVSGRGPEADAVLDALAAVGVDYADVTAVLETEGLEKFEASWAELLDTVATQLRRAQEA